MNRLFSTKSLIASVVALGAVMAGTAAHAGTDVRLVIGLNAPDAYVQPAPVFLQQPAYLQPQTTYVQPRTVQFGHDFDRFERRGGARGDADHDGVPNRFDRDSRFYNARAAQRSAQWGDFDRDGVVNQFDRAPRNPRRY